MLPHSTSIIMQCTLQGTECRSKADWLVDASLSVKRQLSPALCSLHYLAVCGWRGGLTSKPHLGQVPITKRSARNLPAASLYSC